MPRIIFKCPYIKPGANSTASHRAHYVRYDATRDGVELITPNRAGLPATKKQRAMVEQLLRDFPLSRGTFEYEDYKSSPTQGNASEFIARATEDNCDKTAKPENYLGYIARRPRAERVGTHSLFSSTDDILPLSGIADEVASHPGCVWLPIISLRREDAARLGYDSAKQWQAFLTAYAPEISEAMKILREQFRWYASFHDEGSHPHVHMVCYSADGRSGFPDEGGIARIRFGLAKGIYRQELTEIYQRQTQRRDEPAKDHRIAAAYDLWYQLREEVLRTYRDNLPARLPLSRQKEFRQIKNLAVREAVRLGEYTEPFAPTDAQEPSEADTEPKLEEKPLSVDRKPLHDVKLNHTIDATPNRSDSPVMLRNPYAKYRTAKRILADSSSTPEQTDDSVIWLTQAAEAGLDSAQYALGRLYRDGEPVERDTTQAVIWFSHAAEQGNPYAQYFLHHMNDLPSLFTCATQLLHHMGNAFREQAPPPTGGVNFLGSKPRRKIREKKIAMGHKPDDHAGPEIAPQQI